MSDTDSYQIRELPGTDKRVETGPVRFGDDWSGVYIRGDESLYFSMALRRLLVERELTKLDTQACSCLVEILESCQLHKKV